MEEIWKPVKGYEGLYMLSNEGQYYSYPRHHSKGGYSWGQNNGHGYLNMGLSKNNKAEKKLIHRLVYETFIGDIPNGYDVHHINHNRQDNRAENLCLKNASEHLSLHMQQHIEKTISAVVKKLSKPVVQLTVNGVFVAEYPSLREAARQTGIAQASISKCCLNRKNYKTAGGYIWKFAV